MSFIDARKLSVMLHSAQREAEHPGYLALQPICDMLEATARWLSRSRKRQTERDSRRSLRPPPRS